ncbi:9810_t:CDS:2, partial [Funneliformis geosporum]
MLPFVFVASITANIFVSIRLLRDFTCYMTDNLISNLSQPGNDMNDNNGIDEMFASTREALEDIFPKASNKDIERYERQINEADDLDPVLIIVGNQNWINQNTYATYQAVMTAFATNNLQNNQRRDEGSLGVFHFQNMTELYTVRDNIRGLYPNAFFDRNAQPQQEPIGTAWILVKVGVRSSDYAVD